MSTKDRSQITPYNIYTPTLRMNNRHYFQLPCGLFWLSVLCAFSVEKRGHVFRGRLLLRLQSSTELRVTPLSKECGPTSSLHDNYRHLLIINLVQISQRKRLCCSSQQNEYFPHNGYFAGPGNIITFFEMGIMASTPLCT